MRGHVPFARSFVPETRSSRGLLAGIAFLVLVSAAVADSEKLQPADVTWTITSRFEKNDEARTNLSGAACVSPTPPFKSCLIANDQKKYAQFFSIKARRIKPEKVIRLVDKDADGDPDAEGVAYDEGYFYVVGSHGRSRGKDKPNDSSYVVFRLSVDKETGKPVFKVSEDKVVGIEASGRLREALIGIDVLAKHYDRPLSAGGVNIEGVAVKSGRMYLGLRGPSDHDHAFILSVDAKAVFTPGTRLDASIKQLKLGTDAGIRDLAAVRDGLLILSGPVNDQDVTPALFHWSEKSDSLKKLGGLALPASVDGAAKAETLLVLRDEADEAWRVLIMFDGPENGAPTEYLVPR
jgi:hypothetical protein